MYNGYNERKLLVYMYTLFEGARCLLWMEFITRMAEPEPSLADFLKYTISKMLMTSVCANKWYETIYQHNMSCFHILVCAAILFLMICCIYSGIESPRGAALLFFLLVHISTYSVMNVKIGKSLSRNNISLPSEHK